MPDALGIVQGTSTKPAASGELRRLIGEQFAYRGQLFIGYPIVATPDGRFSIDALLISPDKGIVILDLVEGTELGDYQDRQDYAANAIDAKLRTYRDLVEGRQLRLPLRTLTFAPAVAETDPDEPTYPVANSRTLLHALDLVGWEESDERVYEVALSAIQSLSTIRKSRTKRTVIRPDSRGARLQRLEDSIATLDMLQSKAVIETVDDVQRIRGLAGSGKTIVLALKAAYLHAQHPEWRIAVTFNTRSLKGQFRRLINNFFLEQTGEEPDWDNLRIVNAWGAPGSLDRDGIYFEYCKTNGIQYYDFNNAKNTFGRGREFEGACREALATPEPTEPLYQAILVDEAQDFPPEFLQLCYRMLDDSRRLVYAYDELQNLAGRSLPPPEEIFGTTATGEPRVTFDDGGALAPRRDIILEVCYRNSRPVLVTAHALGFGIYRPAPRERTTGLVQMFDHPPLWQEIGYRVDQGVLAPGQRVVLKRTEETSPKFLEEHSPVDDLVQFHRFASVEEQDAWLVDAITRNLKEDELKFDDIVVINPDPVATRKAVGPIRAQLFQLGVNSHLAGVDTDPDVFFASDSPSVTFTGIFRAKGNEAGMVYVINADAGQGSTFNLATVRNRIFTAITRSKAWVRVLGVGPGMDTLMGEFVALQRNDFKLDFVYPTEDQRKELQIVHRDMTARQRNLLEQGQRGLGEMIAAIEAGEIEVQDLSPELRARLQELLRES